MELCSDTQTVVTDAVDESIREVFSMMAGTELSPCGGSHVCDAIADGNPSLDVAVVMGLSGGLQGSLVVVLNEAAALQWTQSLLGMEIPEVDQDVIDAVGEMGNMVVGGTKRRLSDLGLAMSLPSVVRAGIDQLGVPSSVIPVKLGYRFGENPIDILIMLTDSVSTD